MTSKMLTAKATTDTVGLIRKDRVKYEMHVNGYKIGSETGKKLCELGFFEDPFLIGQTLNQKLKEIGFSFDDPRLQVTLRNTPPNHFTFVIYDNPSKRNEVWKKAKEILQKDNEFVGYIEAEVVPLDKFVYNGNPSLVNSVDFSALKQRSFRLRPPELIDVLSDKKKACDIHIKRQFAPLDELDYFFLYNGYYLVLTPRGNKILTIQAESMRDGRFAYDALVDYLRGVGGFKKIDLEITGDYYRKPADFKVAQIVRKGCFTD
jgi:hypothetical protein